MEKLKPVEQSAWANFIYKALLVLTYPLFKLIFSFKVRRSESPPKGSILVLANHQSYIDSLASALPKRLPSCCLPTRRSQPRYSQLYRTYSHY